MCKSESTPPVTTSCSGIVGEVFTVSEPETNCRADAAAALTAARFDDPESLRPEAVRRFRKLVERSGIKKEMRRKEYYEKPSDTKRRARLRAERRAKRTRLGI